MLFSIQKANMWKRFAAWMLDAILVMILATGAVSGVSALLGYDAQYQVVNDGYARYEAQYGVSLDISYEEYGALSEAERKNWDAAANALRTDEAVLEAYSNVIGLTLLITALSVLVAVVICEFVVPLFLHNGQTVGKKIFGLCLIRNDGVKVNNLQLLTRALLCKGTSGGVYLHFQEQCGAARSDGRHYRGGCRQPEDLWIDRRSGGISEKSCCRASCSAEVLIEKQCEHRKGNWYESSPAKSD